MAEGTGAPPAQQSEAQGGRPDQQTGTPPATAPPSQQAEAQTGDEFEEQLKDPAAFLKAHRELQARAKTQANRLAQLEAAHQKAEDAKLSEQERLTKRVADLESQSATQVQAHQERILTYEIKLQASALHIVDPDAACKLLDMSQIEYDAAGQPTNLDAQLKALVKAKPYLIAPTNGQQAATQASSTANPATRSATLTSTTRYSQADLADREFYTKNREDIIRAHREGRIDP